MRNDYGGAMATVRRERCLRYAHRVARRSGRLFWWTVVGRVRRRDGTLSDGGVRGYASAADRRRGIAALRREGFNHFTCFADVNARFALQFGRGSVACVNY